LRLRFLDEATGEGLYRVVDLLVLAVGIAPGPDNAKLAEMLDLKLDTDGFLKDGLEDPADRVAGVFLAGTATGPQSILECIAQATQSVREVRQYLEAKP
jgi:heterodisulfide reductase subunit A